MSTKKKSGAAKRIKPMSVRPPQLSLSQAVGKSLGLKESAVTIQKTNLLVGEAAKPDESKPRSASTAQRSWPEFAGEIPDPLLEKCRAGECVLLAGGGLSAHAGLPAWDQLLTGLLQFAQAQDVIDSDLAASLESALQEGARNAAADGLIQAFGSRRELLQNYLRQLFPKTVLPSAAHKDLAATPFSAAVTTTYDTLIETSFPKLAQSGVYTPFESEALLDALSQKRPFILKLYGLIDRPETLTFSSLDYQEVVSSNVLFGKFMEGFFFSRTFLFVGLSLEGIQDFLSSFVFRGTSPRQHFALVAVSGSAWRAQCELLLRRYNIQVIPFVSSKKFPEVDTFAKKLALATRSETAGAVGSAVDATAVPSIGIRRVVLEDIGPFERLELDFAKEQKWKVLLGDNGVGKSTILKAIAAAIIGNDARSYAARLVRAGKTRGRITLTTDQNPSGYVTEILTKDMLSEADVISIPARPMEAEGWLALGFSPLRVVSWAASSGPQPVVQKGRPSADDLVPLLSGEADPRMDRLKQWIVNLDAANKGQIAPLRTLSGHTDRVSSMCFSADGRTLFSGSIDTFIRVWEVDTGKALRTFKAHSTGVNTLAISKNGKVLVSGSYRGTVRIWNVDSEEELRSLDNRSQVLSVAISADSHIVASGSENGSVRIWDAESGAELGRLGSRKNREVWSVAMSAGGSSVAAACEDGTIRVWDLGKEREDQVLNVGSAVWSVAFSKDGQHVVSGSKNGQVAITELVSGSVTPIDKLSVGVMSVALAEDGNTVCAGTADGTIKLWQLNGAQELRPVRAHEGEVWSAALSSDGRTMASAGDDRTIRLWNVALPEPTGGPFDAIQKFFEIMRDLTGRADIEFLRVTDNFRVYVKVADAPSGVPVEVLSQGLTSLFSWVGVLCQRLKETLQTNSDDAVPTNSYALVLIDELDAHMHPRWQQVLVPRLKKAFPNVQFIACTHSPLIVSGLTKTEVERFALSDGKIEKVDFDPDMTMGRTDQILTGELFGLSSTLDPTTQEMMEEYKKLLGKSKPTAEEDKRRAELGQLLEARIPPSNPDLVARRARELLEVLDPADISGALDPLDAILRQKLREQMRRLTKSLQRQQEEVL